jgi:hypothetical protein
VDKVGVGKRRIVNTRCAAMASHYLFDPEFCNVASGWEKGVVEKNVQDSRRRIWQDAAHLCFGSFAELNVWLESRCQALWSELPYPEVEHLSVADALTMERDTLMPMVAAFDGYVETIVSVSSTCLVSIERNKYSVPCAFIPTGSKRMTRTASLRSMSAASSVARCATTGSTTFRWSSVSPGP